MNFELRILGSNSALPAHNRFPTSQYLNIRNQHILIDCGEGTQIQLQKYKVKSSKIDKIFISHLHGDHIYGLPGLISSYNLNHRTDPLHIYTPKGLAEIMHTILKHSGSVLNFPLEFHEVAPENGVLVFENEEIEVHSLEMYHRIPCCGYVFREKKEKRKINKEKIKDIDIPLDWFDRLKDGEDFIDQNGSIIPNDTLTDPPPLQRSYAFCTDTSYNEALIPHIKQVDLLYHEATFKKENLERAAETFHSTTEQAAQIAKLAEVKKLILGHYSSRYEDLSSLKKEAEEIFEPSDLGLEGKQFFIERIFR